MNFFDVIRYICKRVQDFDDWLFKHPFFHQRAPVENEGGNTRLVEVVHVHHYIHEDEEEEDEGEEESIRSHTVVDGLTRAITGIH